MNARAEWRFAPSGPPDRSGSAFFLLFRPGGPLWRFAILPGHSRPGKILLLLFVLSLLSSARASNPAPKTLVLLTTNISYDDLRTSPLFQDVRRLGNEGGIALVNPAVSGEATDAAAFLTLGAGERLTAPGATGPRITESGVPRTIDEMATEALGLIRQEGGPTRLTYRRRFGSYPTPNAAIAHLGVPVLRKAQSEPGRAALVGALGEALARSGQRVGAYGGWQAALVGMDAHGIVPLGNITATLGPSQISRLLRECDVLLVWVDDPLRLKLLARAAVPFAQRGIAEVLIVCPTPPRDDSGRKWAELGWIIAAGPRIAPTSLLLSPTTRTPGLIANIDIAPTILAFRAAPPLPGVSGRPLTARRADRSTWGALTLLQRQTVMASQAHTAVMLPYALLAIGSCFLALGAIQRGNVVWGAIARGGLLLSAGVFLSLLVAGYLAPPTVWGYVLLVFGVAALFAFIAYTLGDYRDWSPLGILFGATVVVVLLDTLLGSPLTQRAIDNFLPGIRFYGIGNEYLGIVIGAALVGWGLLASRLPGSVLPLVSIALTLVIGLPFCGADAGGALGGAVAFLVARFALRGPLRARQIGVAFVIAFALVALLAVLDGARGAGARSHIGEAVHTGRTLGFGPLEEIAGRKLAMNARLLFHPYTLLALAALTPLGWWLSRGDLPQRVRNALASRPDLARILPACYWGAFATFAFNDSGIVAALLLLACPTVAVLYAMLEDR